MEPETIGVREIREKYNLSYRKAIELLHTEGCPLIQRRKGQPYVVPARAFDRWLLSQVYRRRK